VIKERHLVPGKVIGRLHTRTVPKPGYEYEYVDWWVPCLVIHAKAQKGGGRHAKSKARASGWDVLVFWFDDRQQKLDEVWVASDHEGWKIMWG
jgi:hypothetical protein